MKLTMAMTAALISTAGLSPVAAPVALTPSVDAPAVQTRPSRPVPCSSSTLRQKPNPLVTKGTVTDKGTTRRVAEVLLMVDVTHACRWLKGAQLRAPRAVKVGTTRPNSFAPRAGDVLRRGDTLRIQYSWTITKRSKNRALTLRLTNLRLVGPAQPWDGRHLDRLDLSSSQRTPHSVPNSRLSETGSGELGGPRLALTSPP